MILEKIPECLLAQYYQWLKENKQKESLETLKDWVSREVAYQIQATEINRGLLPRDHFEWPPRNGRYLRRFFGHSGGKKPYRCHVCSVNHPIWKRGLPKVMQQLKVAKSKGTRDSASDVWV